MESMTGFCLIFLMTFLAQGSCLSQKMLINLALNFQLLVDLNKHANSF